VPLTRESSNTGTVSTAWMPGFHEGSESIRIRDLSVQWNLCEFGWIGNFAWSTMPWMTVSATRGLGNLSVMLLHQHASTSYQKPFPAEVKKLGFFELDLAANECRKSIEGSRWGCAPLRKAKKHQCILTNLILWIPYVDLLGDSTVFLTFRIQYPQWIAGQKSYDIWDPYLK
jgi:hypothetical protein